MEVTLVAAMDRNRTIGGHDGGIPWRLPRDSKHFRNYTKNRHMLIGRRTFEEMSGWFTTQTPIVLTRDVLYQSNLGPVATSVAHAISIAAARNESNLVVAGGASVYGAALPHATRMVLTHIDTEVGGDGPVFPEWDPGEWTVVESTRFPPDSENPFAMMIVSYRRQ